MIIADWPVPEHIIAGTTTCAEGNLGLMLPDNQVIERRHALAEALGVTEEVTWVTQVHGDKVLDLDALGPLNTSKTVEADGVMTESTNRLCQVLTADCVPVCFCDRAGQEIMVIHAGWKGLYNQILLKGVKQFSAKIQDILVWVGPCISQQNYEIDRVLYERFVQLDGSYQQAFKAITDKPGHWLFDLKKIVSLQCRSQGVTQIYQSNLCTYAEDTLFYSYRRQGEQAGRQSTFILKKPLN